MQTNVKLQNIFNYSDIHIILIFGLIILISIYFIVHKKDISEKKDNELKNRMIPEINKKDMNIIKNKYLYELNEIEERYNAEKINKRMAYQSISEKIRMFVFEVTNITTQNYTLMEIKKVSIPELYELIKEYYEPEFAYNSTGDFSVAIEKARRVIIKWK